MSEATKPEEPKPDWWNMQITAERLVQVVLIATSSFVFFALLWVVLVVQNNAMELASIRTDLEIAKPLDVLRRVDTLSARVVTKEMFEAYSQQSGLWAKERSEWLSWKADITRRIEKLEQSFKKRR